MDKKFICEDIEPVSLNWNKVDEAMLTSDDLESSESSEIDIVEAATSVSGCEEAVSTLVRTKSSKILNECVQF